MLHKDLMKIYYELVFYYFENKTYVSIWYGNNLSKYFAQASDTLIRSDDDTVDDCDVIDVLTNFLKCVINDDSERQERNKEKYFNRIIEIIMNIRYKQDVLKHNE